MTQLAAPEKPLSRSQRRRRSGVRSATFWGSVLLIGTLFYCGIYQVSRQLSWRRYRQEVEAALQQKDIPRMQRLLLRGRQQFPKLAASSHYASWQKKLQELQAYRQYRAARFNALLEKLQRQLASRENSAGEHTTQNILLAETASYASTPEDLAQLYVLQDQSAALSRNRELKNAARSVEFLQKISALLEKLDRLQKQRNYSEYKAVSAQCKALLDCFPLAGALPENRQQFQALKARWLSSESAAAHAEQQLMIEKNDFENLLQGVYQEELIRRAQIFLHKHPRGVYYPQVSSLLDELRFMQKDFREFPEKLHLQQADRSKKAQQFFEHELRAIFDRHMRGTVFELQLQISGSQEIKRFETYEKTEFSAPAGQQNLIHIKFQDTSRNTISGEFFPDGRGRITTLQGSWHGRLYGGRPVGALPEAHWQQLLYTLGKSRPRSEEFADFVRQFSRKIALLEKLLPPDLFKQLTGALNKADQLLGGAGQFIFQQQFIAEMQKNYPVFAGLIRFEPGKRSEFLPGTAAAKPIQSLWVTDCAQTPVWQLADDPGISEKWAGKIKAAAGTPGNINWRKVLAEYDRIARQNCLVLPELPDWLQCVK